MKIIFKVAFICFITTVVSYGQNKLSLEKIWSGTFRTEGMTALQSMQNTNEYTVLTTDKTTRSTKIDLYDFKSLKKVKTIFDTKDHQQINGVDSYSFDSSEQKMLIASNSNAIFRHSFTAIYHIFDIKSNLLTKISELPIQEPIFSPNGQYISYVLNNNIYLYSIKDKQTVQVTQDGLKNEIINGITDWVYEEEFAFVRAYDWNADGTKLAFIKFDESEVPEFSMDVYNRDLYPSQMVFKYPKAGEKNSKVSLHIYDVAKKNIQNVTLGNYTDFYIPRIKWTSDAQTLSAQVLNRHQNNLDLVFVNATTTKVQLILNEKDKAYVEITDDLTFLNDNSFLWTSERDGYNHIYHYNCKGKLINQLTKGNWDVTSYYGYDVKNKVVYFQSVANGSINRDVYQVQLSGKQLKRLTKETGTNRATFSPDFSLYINEFSSATQVPSFKLIDTKSGQVFQTIVENSKLQHIISGYDLPKKEFQTLKLANGVEVNSWMIKPKNFDANKKYPVLMYQYSGPGSQQVDNAWHSNDDYWFMMLSEQGYIVACVDGRGTGFKGSAFKKVTYKELGKYEVEDQIAAAKLFGGYSFVDASRIGIFGWSFGGFMSSNCLFQGNDVFKTAIAVAPVTSWRFYDSVYTERYMQTPQENASGYDQNSPISHVSKLKGNFLLVHGSADDNVHVQNSMEMIEALIQANKQFDWAIYPDKNHGIYGGATRLQLYTKMTNFLKEKL